MRAGDTLGGIALGLWGDAGLWYKLAEANGLSAGAALSEGQVLQLPAGVSKSTHNASTLKPYDASQALGDTSPTAPKPPARIRGHCWIALRSFALAPRHDLGQSGATATD